MERCILSAVLEKIFVGRHNTHSSLGELGIQIVSLIEPKVLHLVKHLVLSHPVGEELGVKLKLIAKLLRHLF